MYIFVSADLWESTRGIFSDERIFLWARISEDAFCLCKLLENVPPVCPCWSSRSVSERGTLQLTQAWCPPHLYRFLLLQESSRAFLISNRTAGEKSHSCRGLFLKIYCIRQGFGLSRILRILTSVRRRERRSRSRSCRFLSQKLQL